MTVTGGSALAKDDIDRMVREAESHAEEDRQRRETVEMRNTADTLAFSTEKLLKENAEVLTDDVKKPVEEALATLKEALTGDDNDAVKAAMDDLNTKAQAMGTAMYAANQAKQQQESAQSQADGSSSDAPSDDDVVDAEIIDDENKDQQ